jgi:hypothetical protein
VRPDGGPNTCTSSRSSRAAKYDDQVDSTAQFLDWLKQAGREPRGIYQYYKELAQEPQTARPEPLSVMAKRLGLLRW